METGRTENRKLIYELSCIAKSSERADGLVYYKDSFSEDGESRKIWAKRANKKGYCDIIQDASNYYVFRVNEKGLTLLENFSEYYLPRTKKCYNNLNNLTTRERRKLRQLKRENSI